MTGGTNGPANSRTQKNAPKLDHSVLRSSIDVSITGMKQALLAVENGNKEVNNINGHILEFCNVFRYNTIFY